MDVVKIRSDSNISSSTAGTSRSNVNFEQTSSFIGSGVGLYSNFPSTSTSFIAPDAGSLDGDFDGPRYQYDLDFDLEALKRVLSTDHNLDESGYQSVLARSQTSRYGTGWLMCDTESLASNCSADEWGNLRIISCSTQKFLRLFTHICSLGRTCFYCSHTIWLNFVLHTFVCNFVSLRLCRRKLYFDAKRD